MNLKEDMKKEEVYTSEGFEAFLQQASLSGLSRERQEELIAIFLAKDIPLEVVILHSLGELYRTLKRCKLRVFCFVLVAAVLGGLVWSEVRASQGHTEYQAWQWEMAAVWKQFHIKYLGFIDWEPLFLIDCLVPNPIYYLTRPGKPPIDCVGDPRKLAVVDAAKYTGTLNTDFRLPLVLNGAQKEWKFHENSTLQDLHQFLLASGLSHYPCVDYIGGGAVPSQFTADPLAALIDGQLIFEDGRKVESLFLRGCSSDSNRNLRKLSKRPRFIDAHMESLQTMTLAVAKGISRGTVLSYHLKPRDPEVYRKHMWVAQVLGSSNLTLYDLDCPDNAAISATLQPGDIVALGPEDAVTLEIEDPQETLFVYNDFDTFFDD